MKKTAIFSLLLLTVLLLSGCGMLAMNVQPDVPAETANRPAAAVAPPKVPTAEPVQPAEPAPTLPPETLPIETVPPAVPAPAAPMTKEDAEAIALEYVGFTRDQVSYLRTEKEIDDRIPQFDVEFHKDRFEYEFEIHAETGVILSFDKDD